MKKSKSAGLWAAVTLVGLLCTLLTTTPQRAEALSGSEFDPGNIISDANFYDGNAMTEADIQAFLTNASGTCGNANCLAVHRVTTTTTSAGFGPCATYVGAPDESAARIIFKVQQACGISARVLLVTLEKEQGLVTDSAPTSLELRKAMGQGCPDTSDCDANYYGLQKQLYYGSRQLTWYGNPQGSFTYIKVGQSNNIQFHPNTACGTGPVVVKNRATAALYYYTPYQPNAAALANLYGTGDTCSSYGNRNFWRLFNTWFPVQSSVASASITALQASLGGDGGPLGRATSGILTVTANGGGYARAYQNGSIYWTQSAGAHAVLGSVLSHYWSLKGETGFLGWPLSEGMTVTANGGGIGQVFQGGSIYSSKASGTFAVNGPIRDAYWGLAGETGVLGWPASGSIAVSANGSGYGQVFQKGSIYWSSATGAFAVRGGIRDYYWSQKGETGGLGWPKQAEKCGLADGGCGQEFQGGSIYWTPAGGARISSPEIEPAYASAGGVAGYLGKATTGILRIAANGGGVAQAFNGGSIYWTKANGGFVVKNAIKDYYWSNGGETGNLGWPISNEACDVATKTCLQSFQDGAVTWSADKGARLSAPEIDSLYASMGGGSGSLGKASSGLISVSANGGGIGQAFQNGSIYWTRPLGAFAVSGGIRTAYWSANGESGALGWPTAAMQCGLADNGCSQTFQNGTITWSPTAGTRINP